MKTRHIYLSALSCALLLFASCNSRVLYTDAQQVDSHGWHYNQHLYFDVEVTDTVQLYNFLISIRNADTYPYSNAFLFINTTFPDGSVAYDTLECPLADRDGRWYGKQAGGHVDNRYYLRKKVYFPATGTYRFEVFHGMRDTCIAGIKSVGLRIEQSK